MREGPRLCDVQLYMSTSVGSLAETAVVSTRVLEQEYSGQTGVKAAGHPVLLTDDPYGA